jgi:hypothetical protein
MSATIKKQQIITKWKTRLALILTANGYYSNIGQKVYEWKANPFGANRVDGIEIREGDESIERRAEDASIEDHTLPIIISIVSKNPVSIDKAREYEADVRKAVLADQTFDALVDDLEHNSTEMEKEQEKDVIVGIKITFNVLYNTLTLQES